jgi:hypothetical protein
MSSTPTLLLQTNADRTPAARRPQADAVSRFRSQAEDLLRELAFVYHAVDVISRSITAGQGADRTAARV